MREDKETIDNNVCYFPGCEPTRNNRAYTQISVDLRTALLQNELDKIQRQRTAAFIYAPLLFAAGIALGYTTHSMQTELILQLTSQYNNASAEQIDK